MRVRRLTLGPLDTNCWLVDKGAGEPVLIVDPADEPQVILEAVGDATVSAVVLTHGHFDHLRAVSTVIRATGAALLVHEADATDITSSERHLGAAFGLYEVSPPAERLLHDGDTIEVGEISFSVLHTPGHTAGSICLYAPGHLIAGDTLFAGSVGRTDFPGGDMQAMRSSIARLAELPDDTRVYPGHGPETTIARERKVNPFFPRA